MTKSELETILVRLEALAPSSRLSDKRKLLIDVRERIIALRQRGHSWRSLANEISVAIGERVSSDMLRAACMKRARRRLTGQTETNIAPEAKVRINGMPIVPAPQSERFGAKGLKL